MTVEHRPQDAVSVIPPAVGSVGETPRAPLAHRLATILPAALAFAGWFKLREQLYLVHWGRGPTIFLLVVASIVLVLAVPWLARLAGRYQERPSVPPGAAGAGRSKALIAAALGVLTLWSLTDDAAVLRENLGQEEPRLLDIGDATWAAALRFAELGQNPYVERGQLQLVQGPGVTEVDGQVRIFGVPYFYGFAYFPAMFLSYAPFRLLDPGRQSIRIGNAVWLVTLLVGIAWLAYRLAPTGRGSIAAALATLYLGVTSGLGGQLFFYGITDVVVSVYVVLALVAATYRRHLLAGALMGLAFSAKLLPSALLLAVFFVWLARRGGLRPALAGFTVVASLVMLPFVLWHPAGFLSATLLFYITHHAAGDTTSLWYFLPQAARLPFQALGGLAVLAATFSLWRSRGDDQRDLLRAMVVAALAFLATSPMIHLNYQFAIVPLACAALAADAVGAARSEASAPPPLHTLA